VRLGFSVRLARSVPGCARSTVWRTSAGCAGSAATRSSRSHFPHFGEEDCLRGWNGSGTIFFAGCNLRCVFCQNFEVSWQVQGTEAPPERLAAMMLELQQVGCHNINFVTPEHVVPQILEALPLAVEGGLRLPIVYNTSAYDSPESLELMDGVVDIYMPDLKLAGSEHTTPPARPSAIQRSTAGPRPGSWCARTGSRKRSAFAGSMLAAPGSACGRGSGPPPSPGGNRQAADQ
jgi:uncharacterized Fe-S radical SAM superfamily protein PflX